MRTSTHRALRRHARGTALAWALATGAGGSIAATQPIEWDGAAPIERTVSLVGGGHVELCGKLAGGRRVTWSFAAGRALDFNVHYHVGQAVEYPVRRDGVRRLGGRLVAPIEQTYCWMWTNRSDRSTVVTMALRPEDATNGASARPRARPGGIGVSPTGLSSP